MSNKTLYILRGVSGSGKTTLAMLLKGFMENSDAFSADDYFYKNGNYEFDPKKLGSAHHTCISKVQNAMAVRKVYNIVVHNTCTTEKEMKPYLRLAKENGYKVVSLVVENRHGNDSVHDVPVKIIEAQESRLKNSLQLRAYDAIENKKVLGTNIDVSI